MRMEKITEPVNAVFVVAFREIRDQLRDWRIIFPVLGLTIFFPFLMNFTAGQLLGFVNRYGATIIGERLIPFLLMIVGFFPISVSLVIALESFVGERERGSIEPLLNTPLKDWQLYLGKFLSSTVPPLVSSFIGMLVYLAGLKIKGIPWPETPMLTLIVFLTITQAMVMVSGAVVVSSQATSVRAANLLASFIIVPAALLIQGESVLMFWGTYAVLWWVVCGLAVLAVLLIRMGLAHFQREELLGREMDVLNFRWIGRVISSTFKGGAANIFHWYGNLFNETLRSMLPSIGIAFLLTMAGFYLGTRQTNHFVFSLDPAVVAGLEDRAGTLVEAWPLFDFRPVLSIAWHNLRVVLIAILLGSLSLGILGVLPIMLTMGIAGYLLELARVGGMEVLQFAGLILPHGVIEIPAVVIATAAILNAGIMMVTTTPGKTVGEAWLTGNTEAIRVMVGIVLPLLMIAAMVEAWVTPQIALWLIH